MNDEIKVTIEANDTQTELPVLMLGPQIIDVPLVIIQEPEIDVPLVVLSEGPKGLKGDKGEDGTGIVNGILDGGNF